MFIFKKSKFKQTANNTNMLSKEECMYIPFEPKVDYRFLVNVIDENDEPIIASYVICGITRPSFRFNWIGKRIYNNFEIKMYDPIVPGTMQSIFLAMRKKKKWNFFIKILGPVGDIIEKWEINNAKLLSVNSTPMTWNKTGDPTFVIAKFKISNVKLLF